MSGVKESIFDERHDTVTVTDASGKNIQLYHIANKNNQKLQVAQNK